MNLQEFSEKLNKAFTTNIGIELDEKKCEQFFDFMNMLIEKNKVMNLTSITEPDEIIVRHFVDSCMPLRFYDEICENGFSRNKKIGEDGVNRSGAVKVVDCVDDTEALDKVRVGDRDGVVVGDRVVVGDGVRDGFMVGRLATRLRKTRHANFFYDAMICDIGTGAGFPGLPLAIVCDKAKFILTDSLGKRINFLSEVLDRIKITNVKLVKSRAEDFCNQSDFREKFDFVFSRGVAKLSVLSEYCLPAIKVGGKMISFKMNEIESELSESQNAIKTLGGMFHMKHTYDLIEGDPARCLLEINKISKTPKAYPRKAGTPAKAPL